MSPNPNDQVENELQKKKRNLKYATKQTVDKQAELKKVKSDTEKAMEEEKQAKMEGKKAKKVLAALQAEAAALQEENEKNAAARLADGEENEVTLTPSDPQTPLRNINLTLHQLSTTPRDDLIHVFNLPLTSTRQRRARRRRWSRWW